MIKKMSLGLCALAFAAVVGACGNKAVGESGSELAGNWLLTFENAQAVAENDSVLLVFASDNVNFKQVSIDRGRSKPGKMELKGDQLAIDESVLTIVRLTQEELVLEGEIENGGKVESFRSIFKRLSDEEVQKLAQKYQFEL